MTESMAALRENHNAAVEQHEADIFHVSKLRAELEACRSQMDSFNQEKQSGLARSTRYLGESSTSVTRMSVEALEMKGTRDLKDAARALDMIHSSVCGAVLRVLSPNRSKMGVSLSLVPFMSLVPLLLKLIFISGHYWHVVRSQS